MENPANNFIIALLAFVAQRDIAPDLLCKLADIDPKWIFDINRPALTVRQVEDIWTNAVHLTKDPHLGLHFGESVQLAALGIVGQLIKSSHNVGAAVKVAAELGYL